MANALIAHLAEDGVVLWTDANRSDQAHSRRNVFAVGQNFVAAHQELDSWLPALQPIVSDSALSTLDLWALVTALRPRLQAVVSGGLSEPLGVLVGGFLVNGSPLVYGLASWQDFTPYWFNPSVVGAIPSTAILAYLTSALRTLPATIENIADKLLLVGDAYQSLMGRGLGWGPSADLALLTNREALQWLTDGEIANRRARNARRLHSLSVRMMHCFSE